jgi:hypothetical protein
MQKQQLLQLERDKERDNQLAVVKQQLEEAKKVAQDARSDASVRRKNSRVSFSTGPSSGGELADQAAKVAARAQRKAKQRVNEIGVDMNQIRNTAGLSDTVEEFMHSVNNIPALSTGNNAPTTAPTQSRPCLPSEYSG